MCARVVSRQVPGCICSSMRPPHIPLDRCFTGKDLHMRMLVSRLLCHQQRHLTPINFVSVKSKRAINQVCRSGVTQCLMARLPCKAAQNMHGIRTSDPVFVCCLLVVRSSTYHCSQDTLESVQLCHHARGFLPALPPWDCCAAAVAAAPSLSCSLRS